MQHKRRKTLHTDEVAPGSHTIYFSPQLSQILSQSIGPHKNASQRVADIAERYSEILRIQETKVRSRFNREELAVLSLIIVNNYISASQIDTGIPTLVLNNRQHIKKEGIDPIELSETVASLNYAQKCALIEIVAKQAYYEEARERAEDKIYEVLTENEVALLAEVTHAKKIDGDKLESEIRRQKRREEEKRTSAWFYRKAREYDIKINELVKKITNHLSESDIESLPYITGIKSYEDRPEEKSLRAKLTQNEINAIAKIAEIEKEKPTVVARRFEKSGTFTMYKWVGHTKNDAERWKKKLVEAGITQEAVESMTSMELKSLRTLSPERPRTKTQQQLIDRLGEQAVKTLADIKEKKKILVDDDIKTVLPDILAGNQGSGRYTTEVEHALRDIDTGQLKEKLERVTDKELAFIPEVSEDGARRREAQKNRVEATLTVEEMELLGQTLIEQQVPAGSLKTQINKWVKLHRQKDQGIDPTIAALELYQIDTELLLGKLKRLSPVEKLILPQLYRGGEDEEELES